MSETPMKFSSAFEEAMKRVEAKRLMPEKTRLLRRHPLIASGMPESSFAIYHLIGWAYLRGTPRG